MDIMSVAMAKAMMGGGSSGGGLFVVTVDTTLDEDTNLYSATADKTLDQIIDAYKTGLLPVVRVTGDGKYDETGNPEYLYIVGAFDEVGSRYAVFCGADFDPFVGQDTLAYVRAAKVYFAEGEDIVYSGGYYQFPTP